MIAGITTKIKDMAEIFRLPSVTVDLLFSETAENNIFYANLVKDFFATTQRRHPKFPVVKKLKFGIAMCRLPKTFDNYFMMIEASSRRNYKKCRRCGYEFSRIDYNSFLSDVSEIRRSAIIRQGQMPAKYTEHEARPCSNPPSRTTVHDYVYYGVLLRGKLVAYAACFISGEICLIDHIFGHRMHEKDGVVPMLIIDMAKDIIGRFPRVKFYAYGTFFGARPSMRRFLRKFCFTPHTVKWELGAYMDGAVSAKDNTGSGDGHTINLFVPNNVPYELVYRQQRREPLPVPVVNGAEYNLVSSPLSFLKYIKAVNTIFGPLGTIKAFIKLATPSRRFYCLLENGNIMSYGWLMVSACRHYYIEKGGVVIGPVKTLRRYRGRGLATLGIIATINLMILHKRSLFYIDTDGDNVAMQKVISKCGFALPVASYLLKPQQRM